MVNQTNKSIMKKLISSILLMLVLGGFSSCVNDLDHQEEGNYRIKQQNKKPIMKTVKMSFGGDFVSESEEPLLRADDDGTIYTAINVWRTEKNNSKAKEEKYAYGLFKDKKEISMDVVTGFEYRFEATILKEKEGGDRIEKYNGKYTDPFILHTEKTPDFDNAWDFQGSLGQFIYTSYKNINGYEIPIENDERSYFCRLSDGRAYVNNGGDYSSKLTILRYPRIKRFYGNLSTFDPEVDEIADVEMAYKSFGLKVEIASLPSGYVTIEDSTEYVKSDDQYMHQQLVFPTGLKLKLNEDYDGLFSMHKLKAASETFTLKFTWHKGGDVTESFTSDITVKPKTKKVLKLNITGTPNYETKGNIVLTTEDEELKDDEDVIHHDFD